MFENKLKEINMHNNFKESKFRLKLMEFGGLTKLLKK